MRESRERETVRSGAGPTMGSGESVIEFRSGDVARIAIERHATLTTDMIDRRECDYWHVLDFKSENGVNWHADASTVRKRSICISPRWHMSSKELPSTLHPFILGDFMAKSNAEYKMLPRLDKEDPNAKK